MKHGKKKAHTTLRSHLSAAEENCWCQHMKLFGQVIFLKTNEMNANCTITQGGVSHQATEPQRVAAHTFSDANTSLDGSVMPTCVSDPKTSLQIFSCLNYVFQKHRCVVYIKERNTN